MERRPWQGDVGGTTDSFTASVPAGEDTDCPAVSEILCRVRFGLVGTGPWASMAHGPGLRAAEASTWLASGGEPGEAAHSATGLGVSAYDGFEALLGEVDAVAFAVPPEIQAELARWPRTLGSTCCWTSRWP